MESVVLYRKYRPRSFADVVGQEHVVRVLQGALQAERIPHGYIFTGPRGTGKTTVARIFAKALNCTRRLGKPGENSRREPCNACESCLEIQEGRSLDLVEIDAASNRGIDEIRELRDAVRFAPMRGAFKVYIIDEFHMLTKEAFNALLKTLEEPPAHAIFILATTEIQKVPGTIISRALRFDFRFLTEAEIIKELERILKNEGLEVEREALSAIAAQSGGSLRDAESTLEQLFLLGKKKISYEEAKAVLGFTDLHLAIGLAQKILAGDAGGALADLDGIYERGEDLEELFGVLTEWFRKLLLLRVDSDLEKLLVKNLSPDHVATLRDQAARATARQLGKIESLMLERELEMRRTSFPRLCFELAIVQISELLTDKESVAA